MRAPNPVKHRSALKEAELPGLIAALDAYDGEPMTHLALKLVLLTFVRTPELRFADWSEFEGLDGDEPLWRIPAERVKMRRAKRAARRRVSQDNGIDTSRARIRHKRDAQSRPVVKITVFTSVGHATGALIAGLDDQKWTSRSIENA